MRGKSPLPERLRYWFQKVDRLESRYDDLFQKQLLYDEMDVNDPVLEITCHHAARALNRADDRLQQLRAEARRG